MTTVHPPPAEGQPADAPPRLAEQRPRPPLLARTVLDEQVAAAMDADPRPWGVRTWLGPLVTLVALVGGTNALEVLLLPRQGNGRLAGGIALTVGGELLLLAALVAFGRPIAARHGGWRNAFGLDRIRGGDWAPWALGLVGVFIGRTTVGMLATALAGTRALREASNVHLSHPRPVAIVVLAVVVVVLAPITEDLMFRGLLLRSMMRRLRFWPAALLSSGLFALLHMYEVRSLLGAATLAASVFVLGLVAAYLVRITGRLAPGMMLHAAFNGLALGVALLQVAASSS